MANNDRMQYQAPTILIAGSPQVEVDDGTSSFLRTRAAVFLNNANEAHKRQLQADLDLATKEGERVGYNLGAQFRPVKNGSLFSRHFNESGFQWAGEKVSSDSQRAVKRMMEKHPANPGAIGTDLEAYKEGKLSELPEEMQTVFSANFDRLRDAAIEQAKAARKQLDAQAAAANFFGYEREVTNTLEKLAPSTFKQGPDGDAARAAVAMLRQNYMESLSRNGPEGEYEIGGYKIKSAAGRSGAFTPLEMAKKIQAFDNQVIAAGVLGNYQDEVKNGRGVEAYMAFAKGEMEVSTVGDDGVISSQKISDLLTNDEMDEITGKMRTYIGGIRSIEDGEFKMYERGRKLYNDQVLQNAYASSFQVSTDAAGNKTVLGGDPVALQNMIGRALQDPMIETETIDKLQKLATQLGSGDIDNPTITGPTWLGITTGDLKSYNSLPTFGISDTTRVEMYNALDQRNKGQHWTQSNRYRTASDYADAVLAPAKSAGFSLLGDPDSEAAADRSEWNRRMIEMGMQAEKAGTLPQNMNGIPVKDEFDFYEVGKQIADEIKARRDAPKTDPAMVELDTQIKEVETQMNNPQPGDDPEKVKARYRELQQRKSQLQTNNLMGQ